jgi:hypothetical protein
MFFDIRPAKEALAWTPSKSNEEMLVESYEDYVAHRHEVLTRRGASRIGASYSSGTVKRSW